MDTYTFAGLAILVLLGLATLLVFRSRFTFVLQIWKLIKFKLTGENKPSRAIDPVQEVPKAAGVRIAAETVTAEDVVGRDKIIYMASPPKDINPQVQALLEESKFLDDFDPQISAGDLWRRVMRLADYVESYSNAGGAFYAKEIRSLGRKSPGWAMGLNEPAESIRQRSEEDNRKYREQIIQARDKIKNYIKALADRL